MRLLYAANKVSTGAIEFLRCNGVSTVIVGGLALDYCVKQTLMQLRQPGFEVIVNLGASRGLSAETTAAALNEMQEQDVRQDSGDTFVFAERFIQHLRLSFGIKDRAA